MRGAKQKEMLEISDFRRGEILHLRSAGPFSLREGGGGTLIFSYIHRLRLFYGGQNLNFNILWVFRKLNNFGGMKILWIFFGGTLQNWTIFRGHFYAL